MDGRRVTRRGTAPAARGSRRRVPSARLTAATALIAAVGVACRGGASTAAAPRPAPAMTGGSYPGAIAAGADGNLWFTEPAATASGGSPRRARSPSSRRPHRRQPARPSITAGPDGNLWFTERRRAAGIGRITPEGVVTEFSAGHQRRRASPAASPRARTATCGSPSTAANRIGRITPPGVVTEFSAGLTRRAARPASPPAPTATSGSPSAARQPHRAHHPGRRGHRVPGRHERHAPSASPPAPTATSGSRRRRDRIGRITPPGVDDRVPRRHQRAAAPPTASPPARTATSGSPPASPTAARPAGSASGASPPPGS